MTRRKSLRIQFVTWVLIRGSCRLDCACGDELIGSHLNLVGVFPLEPLNRIIWFSPAILDVGEIGSLGNPRVGDWSGGHREIKIADVSKMQMRVWLIPCRLKKQEKVKGCCDIGDSWPLSVDEELVDFACLQCSVVCAPWLAKWKLS